MLTRRRHDCTVEGETAMSEDKPQPDHERDILAACEIPQTDSEGGADRRSPTADLPTMQR